MANDGVDSRPWQRRLVRLPQVGAAAQMAIFLLPDESQSAKNSFFDTLSAVGLWDLFLLLLITHNLEHGPKQSEERRTEFRTMLGACHMNRKPKFTPLFLRLVPDMQYELETFANVQFPGPRA